ncbi:MAG TPA: DUF3943 domain-containing protein [Burkholderiales bacterium]|jgi:hypothetical protein|nr:DUF3943 domain-containing protein [Burkholderiales bacterium]
MLRAFVFWSVAIATGAALAQEQSLPDLGSGISLEKKETKSYAIPAAEIVAFEFLLNRIDKRIYGEGDYAVTTGTIKRNLQHSWVVDDDPYKINQLGHPYQGSIYYGLARSAGLGFWESFGYTFAGSALWEYAGETTLPSKNDQIASGVAGSFLGESLFRMANLVLEHGDQSFWREASAAVISPGTGFNRFAWGERFRKALDSKEPAYYSRVQVGASGATHVREGDPSELKRNELLLDYSMDYGLPGKRGYHYDRPWDYFSFQITASSANAVENLSTRGLLFGTGYEAGERYRGLWGLYGSYDYIAPQLFRVSSTALSLGTTGQLRLADQIAVMGTVTAGVGYASVGSIHSTSNADYHYGTTPQALAALRVIFGDRWSLDATGREFFVSSVGGTGTGGHDNIVRGDVALTVRVRREHGIALKYLWSRRDATFANQGDVSQTHATIGLYYVYLGRERFGAVDWR